jgi:hypothetical protein
MNVLGVSLLVGGVAFLCSGLIFLLPTERKTSSHEKSVQENQEAIELYLQQIHKQHREV